MMESAVDNPRFVQVIAVPKRRGRPPLPPEELVRRQQGTTVISEQELARRRAISESVSLWHRRKGHRMSPITPNRRMRMKVENGYVELVPCEGGFEIQVTEVAGEIPSGSRTARVKCKAEHASSIFAVIAPTPPALA